MTNSSRFTTAILVALTIAAALVIAGCTSPSSTATPTPAPTATATPTPTATPVPGNQTLERQYQYVERFQAGINYYNTGIALLRDANNTSVTGDYTNASQQMLLAKDRMDAAANSFAAMKPYAGNAAETSLSDKWAEVAGYESMSVQNASDAFAAYAYEATRPNPNWVRGNGYLAQANYYSNMASEVRAQADALQGTLTFLAPTARP